MRSPSPWLCGLLLCGCVSIPEPANNDGGGGGGDCADLDNDGYLPEGCPSRLPADCEPTNGAIHPAALDICGNGIDENCDDTDLDCSVALQGLEGTDLDPTPNISQGLFQIVNAHLTATFDADQGFVITDLTSAAHSTENLLYDGPMNEKYIGNHFWEEAFSRLPDSSPPDIAVLASGPAAYRFRVNEWKASATEGNPSLEGTTTYALYPDGRIVRGESIDPSDPTGVNQFFTSNLSLEPGLFTHVTDTAGAASPVLDFDVLTATHGSLHDIYNEPTNEGDLRNALCAVNDSNGLLVSNAWTFFNEPAGEIGPRVVESAIGLQAANHALALNFDWQRNAISIDGDYQGAFQVWVGQAELSSVDETPCVVADPYTQAFVNPMQIAEEELIDPATLGDDDDDGYNEFGGFYQVRLPEESDTPYSIVFSFEQTENGGVLGPGTAIRIANIPEQDLLPIVILNENNQPLVHGRDYLLQVESNSSLWLFLDNSAGPPSSVRVEWP